MLKSYIKKLNDGIEEKLFFTNLVDLNSYDIILDFGCGDGEILRRLYNITSYKIKYIGYDSSIEMIKICNEKSVNYNIKFINDEKELFEFLDTNRNKKILMIFSSVLHECYEEQKNKIFLVMNYATTIVIRDMKRPLNNEWIPQSTISRITKKVAPWQVKMFEDKWGKIEDKYNLYRFFLMNEFVDNFENEVKEDYFSVNWSEIDERLIKFERVYERSYTLPYRRKQVQALFSHDLKDITHKEVIYQREEE